MAGSADMRDLLARDDGDARLALDVYLHRLRAGIGAMAAALDGLDALVFTGGVGENAAAVRERAAAGLRHLGVAIDPDANAAPGGDRDVSRGGAAARTLVVRAREDLEIARQVGAALAGG
jgi:acetate kinase